MPLVLIVYLELVLIKKYGIIRSMKIEYKATNYPSDLTDEQREK